MTDPKLSERIRPNSEAAPWVVDAVMLLEQELDAQRKRADSLALAYREQQGLNDTLQLENRKLRDVLEWTNTQCPGKCAGVCGEALWENPSSPLVEELVLLRSELQEQARLVGMGSEREARLMAQLEEARKELQRVTESVMGALPATTVAFTGDYGMYVRACIEHLLLQELLKQDRK